MKQGRLAKVDRTLLPVVKIIDDPHKRRYIRKLDGCYGGPGWGIDCDGCLPRIPCKALAYKRDQRKHERRWKN